MGGRTDERLLEDELRHLAERFHQEQDRLVRRQVEMLDSYPSYRDVPRADLRRSAARNVARVVEALQDRSQLPSSETEHEQDSLRLRMQQGVPGDDVIDAHRVLTAMLRDEFINLAQNVDAPLEATLVGVRRIWEAADLVLSDAVSSRYKADLALAVRQEGDRANFFARLLAGALTSQETAAVGPRYDVHETAEYWLALVHGASIDVIAEIERLGRGNMHRPVVGMFDDRLAALVSRPLPASPVFDSASVVCVGPYLPTDLHHGAAAAAELMAAARAFNITGVVTTDRMGLRIALARDREVSEVLYAKYVEPLETGSAAVDTISTVRAFLQHHRSVPDTAVSLFVHQNTVRYRLSKFATATGADLNDTETLAEVWWALEYAAVRTTL